MILVEIQLCTRHTKTKIFKAKITLETVYIPFKWNSMKSLSQDKLIRQVN